MIKVSFSLRARECTYYRYPEEEKNNYENVFHILWEYLF